MRDHDPKHGWSRRQVIRAMTAAGVGTLLPASGLVAQGNPRRIDVHHHPAMPGEGNPENPATWTLPKAIEMMDKFRIETTIMSSPPNGAQASDGTDKVRTVARQFNEFAAKIVSDNPKRFGFFATIPYTDTEGSMRELEYAFGTLKADGVVLTSSFGNNKYAGDPAFDAVWQELNRRKVIIFIHPVVPQCCRGVIPGGDNSVERDFDTTRTVTNLLYSGTLSKYPDIRYIINHAGAAVPVLAGRIKDRIPGFQTNGTWVEGRQLSNSDGKTDKIPNGVFYELKKLYYEIAHASYPAAMGALTAFAPPSQYLFGTDFPAEPMESTVDELPASKLSPQVLQALYRGNAEKLWPRFKSS